MVIIRSPTALQTSRSAQAGSRSECASRSPSCRGTSHSRRAPVSIERVKELEIDHRADPTRSQHFAEMVTPPVCGVGIGHRAALDASTVTPGSTAPEPSLTTPAIDACACARAGTSNPATISSTRKQETMKHREPPTWGEVIVMESIVMESKEIARHPRVVTSVCQRPHPVR